MSLELEQIKAWFIGLGCNEFLIKQLAPNDNSKNQPYIAKDRDAAGFSLLPAENFRVEGRNFHADLDFSWVDDRGEPFRAPHAKLVQYTRYKTPEVRLSGFLRGCKNAPNALMTTRVPGRVLFLGVDGSKIYASVVGPTDPAATQANELVERGLAEQRGALYAAPLTSTAKSIVETIESSLLAVHRAGWLDGTLLTGGIRKPHVAPNSGGTTLEAFLGVEANSATAPDYLGWELKAVQSKSLDVLPGGKVATLITPAPTGGFYRERGVVEFMQRFGYPAMSGEPDRLNFGGVHRIGSRAQKTNSILELDGFDRNTGPLADGSIRLIMSDGSIGAVWPFAELMAKWNRKHAQTVYVPYEREGGRYRFSKRVKFCRGSSFGRFLGSMEDGFTYYDPGLKLTDASSQKRKAHARHQFRIKMRDMDSLYASSSVVELTASVS